MRRPSTRPLALFLLLTPLPTAIAASINLSDFQPISGFPTACANAYNTPLIGCSASDFDNGAPCSSRCIAVLQTLTTSINSACQGSEADPSTLIGLFFVGKGVDTLCPNVDSTSATSATQQPTTTTSQSSAIVVTTSERTTSSTSTSSTSSSTTAGTSSFVASIVSVSTVPTSSSLTTSITSEVISPIPSATSTSDTSSTSSPSTTKASFKTTAAAETGFTKTIANDGSATVLTSKTEQTDSSNPDAFGGGGSPFEISGAGGAPAPGSLVAILGAAFGLFWLF